MIQRIVRAPIPIMLVRVADEVAEMRRAWPHLENLVGMRGRQFYGVVNDRTGEYYVSARIRDDDPADRFGLEVGEIAGGAYLRTVLKGEPPGVYDGIGPACQQLHGLAEADGERHDVEFYRRRGEIEIWMPVL
ncbi:MAG TPA: hypothetical protein VH352_24345 [Pseudonocardiaceae bacterium]|nr:hypothetical protein [Pseudonocardiaceae bacterium]